MTALWRALHDDYDDRIYLVDIESDKDYNSAIVVRSQSTYDKEDRRYPLWLESSAECWNRGLIPLSFCCPDTSDHDIDEWSDAAAEGDSKLALAIYKKISRYSTTIENFNIPFLSLPPGTPKETALDVFINMNTSSVKLSSYDIIVAQYEAKTSESLHDQVAELEAAVPRLVSYRGAENLLLDIAALSEDRPPTQASYHRLDSLHLSERFEELTAGAAFAVKVLEDESIFDSDRLPTIAVLPVLGALEPHVPRGGDERGNAISLIRAYLWRSFTTGRYESAAATRALQDLRGLIAALGGGTNTAPIFDENTYHLPQPEEVVRARWPKSRQTLARAILCASIRRGAFDLADGTRATSDNIITREYHHIFPDAYLKQEGNLKSDEIDRALNCSLITWVTNRRIGAKPPLAYLKERIELASLGEDEVRRRLESHIIPWDEFADSSREGVADSYRRFLEARSTLIAEYFTELCHGREPNT